MMDIHCHILPGLDDGAANDMASLEMAKAAVAEGITHIIATPHHRHPQYNNDKTSVLKAVDQLNQLLKEESIDLEILPGQEVRIFGEMLESLDTELLTLNKGKYLFVEFPSSTVPQYAHQLFYDLMLDDIIPVVVHPERNQELIQHPETLYRFVKNGALTQVTAASVIGKFGKKIQRFTHQLIENNLTHFVASDAHNITTRGFHLREALSLVEREYGISTRFFLQDNAELLADRQTVYQNEPMRIKTKKFFNLF